MIDFWNGMNTPNGKESVRRYETPYDAKIRCWRYSYGSL